MGRKESNPEKKIKKKQTFSASVGLTLIEWAEITTGHGFVHLVRPIHIIFKVIWIVAISLVIGYCLFTIHSYLISFYLQETTTSVKKIYESPHIFPALTLCNLNRFKTDAGANNVFFKEILNKRNRTIPLDTQNKIAASMLLNEANILLKSEIKFHDNGDNITLEDRGFKIKEMLISMKFAKDHLNYSQFTYTYNSDYGNCYTFNSYLNQQNPEVRKIIYGSSAALEMEIFTGYPGITDLLDKEQGLLLYIHNNSAPPNFNGPRTVIQTGASTSMAISKIVNSKTSTNSELCRSDLTPKSTDSVYFRLASLNQTYSRDICREIYGQIEYVIKNCKCISFSTQYYELLRNEYNVSLCRLEENVCANNQLSQSTSAEFANGDTRCPLECESEEFEVKINTAVYPSKSYIEVLRTSEALSMITTSAGPGGKKFEPNFETSFLQLKIYYENAYYTAIKTEITTDISTLVGLIGGIFGLCGFSFLTLLDVAFMILQLLKIIFCCVRKDRVLPENKKQAATVSDNRNN